MILRYHLAIARIIVPQPAASHNLGFQAFLLSQFILNVLVLERLKLLV